MKNLWFIQETTFKYKTEVFSLYSKHNTRIQWHFSNPLRKWKKFLEIKKIKLIFYFCFMDSSFYIVPRSKMVDAGFFFLFLILLSLMKYSWDTDTHLFAIQNIIIHYLRQFSLEIVYIPMKLNNKELHLIEDELSSYI